MIVCLLVAFNSFSQTTTKSKSVVLTENQAREVIKDLVHYEVVKEVVELQDQRIGKLKEKEALYQEQLDIKDTIISKQVIVIDKQNRILSKQDRLKLGGYLGLQTNELIWKETYLRGDLLLEYRKIRAGAVCTVKQDSQFSWGLLVQYKIF